MPVIKGQKYNIEPKLRIKKVFDKVIESGGAIGTAMVEEGYSKKSAINPKKLTDTKSWQKLLDKYIPDSKLTEVLKEGLEASKEVWKNNNESGEVEKVSEEPDYAVRHKYLETGLKLKSKFPKEDPEPENDKLKGLVVIVNNILDGQNKQITPNLQISE